MCVTCFLYVFTEAFINVLATALTIVIFVRVILSWVPMRLPLDLGDLVFSISETILGPIRRALPFMGGLDLSPFIALIAIQVLQSILLRLLPYPG
jgi:YggT family protein